MRKPTIVLSAGLAAVLLVGMLAAPAAGDVATRSPGGAPVFAAAAGKPKVRAVPDTGLVDYQEISVTGTHFSPDVTVAALQCRAGATGEDGCDLATLTYLQTGSNGSFSHRKIVRRLIFLSAGTVDCASAPGACVLASANIADISEAASTPLSFNPAVPPVPLAVRATPHSGLADHQLVQVEATGMAPRSYVEIVQCAGGQPPSITSCDLSTQQSARTDARGSFTLSWPVHRMLLLPSGTVDCGSAPKACLVAAGATLLDGSSGGATANLSFDPDIPPVVATASVSPTTGLIDHELVSVRGAGFTPGAALAAIECRAGVTGAADCDLSTERTVTAGPTGRFSLVYPVERLVDLGGKRLDCGSAPGACVLVAANPIRTSEAVLTPIGFDPSVPPAKQVLAVTPHAGLTDDQQVSVTGSGFTPFESVPVEECSAEAVPHRAYEYCSPVDGAYAFTDASGSFTVSLFVHAAISGPSGLIDCRQAPGACVVGASLSAFENAFSPIAFKRR